MSDLARVVAHLAAAADALARVDFAAEPALDEAVVELRRQVDRVEASWLRGVAVLDAGGESVPEGSAGAWLRRRCRMHPNDASARLRTARLLAQLPETAAALQDGDVSPRHGEVIAGVVSDLGLETAREAEPVLLEAARKVDPKQLRRLTRHLRQVVDPAGAEGAARREHARRRLSLSETFDGLFHLEGVLDAESGSTLLAALTPLSAPHGRDDTRTAAQRRADAITELARRQLDAGGLPQLGGERPHLTVTTGLATLRGEGAVVPAQPDWGGPVAPDAARRLACDATVTRVSIDDRPPADFLPGLPPVLRDAPPQVLDVGRATRVISPAQRRALASRDGGCRFPYCDSPAPWTDAHHIHSWATGGPTDLNNLVLLCRRHHRSVHEGGWAITGNPNNHLRFNPPRDESPRHEPPRDSRPPKAHPCSQEGRASPRADDDSAHPGRDQARPRPKRPPLEARFASLVPQATTRCYQPVGLSTPRRSKAPACERMPRVAAGEWPGGVSAGAWPCTAWHPPSGSRHRDAGRGATDSPRRRQRVREVREQLRRP